MTRIFTTLLYECNQSLGRESRTISSLHTLQILFFFSLSLPSVLHMQPRDGISLMSLDVRYVFVLIGFQYAKVQRLL